ncbi:type B 50S ribosomal protein L31 [Amnimonas aquatica]|uniref:Large ribosomal subunit protein bL31B n=1 Tax=Amnimonas aquatica TaxID=2094561 RepID=A0A2P6ASC7_9GAMM|nr:type B 50S ribosomal protein L31 [Amnimonas aquatica]PQA41706.1 50S ribosomal protein L31 [Amnimonas aquatica]
MKPGIHPTYRPVLFHDTTADVYFLIGSTVATSRTQVHSDGNTYPYVALDISSASHPFYTGQSRQAKAEGRVARFNQRYGRRTGVTGDAGKGEQ